ISASGSASFNVGLGNFAANKGAHVVYFYNSKEIPSRTEKLFTRPSNPVIPLELDIGPQAICGSTRLQAATVTEACITSLLASSLYLSKKEKELSKNYAPELLVKMKNGLQTLSKSLENIVPFVKMQTATFSSPTSNFHKLRDETDQGYVTFLTDKGSIREVFIDVAEMPPTFSTNPIRKEGDSTKRSEFSAYLLGTKDNKEAWKALLGRHPEETSKSHIAKHLLATEASGQNSFIKRPQVKGNCVIGVHKLDGKEDLPKDLVKSLKAAKTKGADTGIVLICSETLSQSARKTLQELQVNAVVLENISTDLFGCNQTIILKMLLNLISNSSMIQMKKVYGNRMIDVRASNGKLIDRTLRLIQ